MPFPNQTPRAFTRANIEAIPPGTMGCYGIFRNQGPWIYIGKGDIRERLLAHLNGDNSCITNAGPTHYMDEITADYDARERALILELGPTLCNQRVG
jgi:hypothetical protein